MEGITLPDNPKLGGRIAKQDAIDLLFEAVYIELRRLARDYLRDERTNHTLQTTALVHEAYLRLAGGQDQIIWESRPQFFSIAAKVMRHILVDHARRYTAQKRGNGIKLSLDDAMALVKERDINLVSLDDALQRLAILDSQQARIVELRFFGGLTINEIAELLQISEIRVSRDWKTAKLWLHNEVSQQT